ncbi:hypothetical protein BC828DRAFT_376263 [Blastocladiella britannica]|nr:hypothetical protein BC828DRAFT_376263 [Blastocladiella britannica]
MHSNWRPDHFWIDFDGTLTAADTIAALGEYASSVSHTESAWDDAVAAYLADYAEAVKSTPVPPFPVPPILSQIDNPAVRQALAVVAAHIAAVRPAEDASLARIHRAGIFRGLSARGLTEAVQHRVELAAGALDALAAFGDRVTVCSVNWSADWIAGALSPWCGRDICCSDLAWNGEMEVSTGIQPTIVDGMDKLATMQRRGFKPNVLVVAVGDAINDLPCLRTCFF